MVIRYFCDTRRPQSYHYYLALKEVGVPIRIIAIDFANILTGTYWADHVNDFATAVTEPYLNVVCGTTEELGRFWTANVANIGIHLGDSDELDTHTLTRMRYDAIVAEPPEELAAQIQAFL